MENLTNQEKKKAQWDAIKSKFSHLENHCEIILKGIEDDSIYYHPQFVIKDEMAVSCQADVGDKAYSSGNCYAFKVYSEKHNLQVNIDDSLLDAVIVSWSVNKDSVLTALESLQKVRNHITSMQDYAEQYVVNLLIGNSINQLTNDFINEIKTTSKVITLMQNATK